jgi:hypothetical protein
MAMTRGKIFSMLLIVLLAGALVPACNVFLPAVGGAGQPCRPDLACDPGLFCIDNRCVSGTDGGDGGGPDGEDAGDAGMTDAGFDGGDGPADGGDAGGCVQVDDCDDDNPCTEDGCDQEEHICHHVPKSGDCDDGDPCTLSDKCQDGACEGVPKDSDKDGFVDASCNGDDCDDDSSSIHPGAPEGPPGSTSCSDHLDNNCDGQIDTDDIGCKLCTSDPECDDGFFCTGPEKCESGRCIRGAPPCQDNLSCTRDACVEQEETCSYPLEANTCLIEGRCYINGDRKPNEQCWICDASSPDIWTFDTGGPCDDSNPCTENDRCDKNVCGGTTIDHDHDGYAPLDCGLDCDDYNIAVNPGATEGPFGSQSCVDIWDNDCDGQTDQNDTDCGCVKDDQCSDNNRCNGQEACVGGICMPPSTSPCGLWCIDCTVNGCPIASDSCLIQNLCYMADEQKPGDPCLVCAPSQDQEHWTSTCR